jgi:hypothetical protein
MPAILCVVLTLVAVAAGHRMVGNSRRRRGAAGDTLKNVFEPNELRALNAHLDAIARDELLRLDAALMRYLAGEVGHVVVVSDASHGITLELSDGRLMTLEGISRLTRRRLLSRAAQDSLRPTRLERDAFSYRLLLCSEAGAAIECSTRRLVLAP